MFSCICFPLQENATVWVTQVMVVCLCSLVRKGIELPIVATVDMLYVARQVDIASLVVLGLVVNRYVMVTIYTIGHAVLHDHTSLHAWGIY